MKHFIFIFLCVFFITGVVNAKEPANLNQAKQRLIRYHDSGEYLSDIKKVEIKAQNYLARRIKENQANKKLAIVFDIDETTLSGYKHYKAYGFGGNAKVFDQMIRQVDYLVISPALQLYRFAQQHHVAVFFITGRPKSERVVTIKNLREVGYNHWSGLYLTPATYHQKFKSIIPFKTKMRKKIEAKGYDIVMTIGDQSSDLKGGYADRGIKLPNPYYFVP